MTYALLFSHFALIPVVFVLRFSFAGLPNSMAREKESLKIIFLEKLGVMLQMHIRISV